jgi:hypothetical protein
MKSQINYNITQKDDGTSKLDYADITTPAK